MCESTSGSRFPNMPHPRDYLPPERLRKKKLKMTPQSSNISHRGTHFIELCTGEKKVWRGRGGCRLSVLSVWAPASNLKAHIMLRVAFSSEAAIWNLELHHIRVAKVPRVSRKSEMNASVVVVCIVGSHARLTAQCTCLWKHKNNICRCRHCITCTVGLTF